LRCDGEAVLGSSLIDSPCLFTGPFERRTRRQSAEVQLELKTIVERLLEQEPGAALCDACLAFAAAAASLLETRGVIEALVRVRPTFKRSLDQCESCSRDTMVTACRPEG
jgi:hypothetical protein